VVDRTYLPRWSLTNYYLRRGNLLEFWVWAERAAQMPPGDVGPLFQICWRVEPDPAKIEARIVGNDPALTLKFLEFLLDRNQVSSAAPLASRLLVIGAQKDDLSAIFDVVNSLVRAGDAAAASALWHQMMSRNWVFADAAFPYNGDFARDPLPVLFDWSVAGLTGIHSWTGHGGLVSELTGSQPENCVIAQEVVPLLPGSYRMYYSYRTTGIPPGSGLRWQLLSAPTGALVAQSGDLSSDYLKPDMLKFLVPSYQSLYTLRLVYIRTPGTTRVSGTLVSGSVRLQVDSQQ
jgi:pentatricopeptide repeat protein